MGGFVGNKVQVAIDNILIADSTLIAMLGDGVNSIIDNPSQADRTVFPFIRYDMISQSNFDSKTFNGSDTTFQISVFSRSGNKSEASDILERVYDLLHNANLAIVDTNTILCRWTGVSDISVDDSVEYLLYRGIIRFNILSTEG